MYTVYIYILYTGTIRKWKIWRMCNDLHPKIFPRCSKFPRPNDVQRQTSVFCNCRNVLLYIPSAQKKKRKTFREIVDSKSRKLNLMKLKYSNHISKSVMVKESAVDSVDTIKNCRFRFFWPAPCLNLSEPLVPSSPSRWKWCCVLGHAGPEDRLFWPSRICYKSRDKRFTPVSPFTLYLLKFREISMGKKQRRSEYVRELQ